MGLRLMLVSMVAGLGLTLPSGSQVAALKESAQSWVNARLAEWDARMPADEKAFVYAIDSAPTAADEAASVARPDSNPAPAVAAGVPAARTGPADSEPAARAETAAAVEPPTAPMAFDENEFEPEPAASPTAAVVSRTVATDSDADFLAAQDETLKSFDADALPVDAFADIERVEVVRVENAADLAPRAPSVESPDDLYGGVAYALNRDAEGLDLPATAAASVSVKGVVSKAAPAGENDDLYGGVAYALNREAEGLDLISDGPANVDSRLAGNAEPRSEVAPKSDRLVHAVRLTREAVYAWANLLHGPAVVTINH